MIQIAEFLPPTPTPLWKLAKQAGVDYAVGGLPFGDPRNAGDAPWDYRPLQRMQGEYEAGGFKLAVIENRPPLNKAKRGLPGRDEEIDTVCTLLENMGKLGVPVWCYEWMPVFNWIRTAITVPSRGGALVTGFDNALMKDAPLTDYGVVTEDHPVQVQEVADRDGQHRHFAEEVAVAPVGAPEGRPVYYICSGCHDADSITTNVVIAMVATGAAADSPATSRGATRSAVRRDRGSSRTAR